MLVIGKSTIQKRYDWVTTWKDLDMDFSKNCVFTDEASFNINMRSSRAWAPKWQMAVVTTPTTKALSPTVIGTVSSVGVINLSVRMPKQPPEIRKVQGDKKKSIETISREEEPKDATAGHYVKFLEATLDKHDQMRGFHLVMDNAPIHSSKQMAELIESRSRTKPVYLPPHSPELNPKSNPRLLLKEKSSVISFNILKPSRRELLMQQSFPSISPKHNPAHKKSV